jgi:hypothetical protein
LQDSGGSYGIIYKLGRKDIEMQVASTIALFFGMAILAHAQSAVTGKWDGTTKDGSKVSVDLKADGKVLTGTVTVAGRPFPVEDGKIINSKTISFAWTTAFPPEGRQVHFSGKGAVGKDEIKLPLTVEIVDTGQKSDDSITLKRAR